VIAQAHTYWLGSAPNAQADAWVVDAGAFDAARPGLDVARTVVCLRAAGTRGFERALERPRAAGIGVLMLLGARDISDVCAITECCPQTVMPVIDTLQGLDQLRAIANLPGVARLVFDGSAIARQLGIEHEDCLLAHRAHTVLASRLAGLPAPVDDGSLPPERARQLGFGACLCRDAADLKAAHLAFASSRSSASPTSTPHEPS